MTKFARFTLHVGLLVALSFVRPTWATSFSNDQSDLWWNASEDGWGIQFVQRGKTIFATMFVYDAAGNPTWYVATMDGAKPAGVLTFSGDLYTTHGTWFGAVPYNPANFGAAKVGTMTWQKSFGEPGTLTYSVSGVNVTKSLVRQPIGSDDYTGTYNAGLHLVDSGCTNPAKNGPIDGGDTLAITHIGAAITLMFVKTGCTLGGTYGQNGQFGTASGNYSCSSGDMGTFTLSNMNVTPYSMSALLSTSSTVDGCQGGGQIGGVRNDK
jgi:hypothetical protein